ncbi:hypothetical protein BJB45_05385 [Halomonas huangheensis]|uniref:Uncharacterized protein n=2 Tax=Halomonas huangheensis TaxID=1178482 RepID=W1N5V6_9GAMM|nr:hypothetical protein AR456_06755 [Halomonas huangheensis]ERL50561.1 hypothetical protein BJB45_05385 [Halomonas huangheensis]
MVFGGLTVDFTWQPTMMEDTRAHDENSSSADPQGAVVAHGAMDVMYSLEGKVHGKKIMINVTVPDLDHMELGLTLATVGSFDSRDLFDYTYRKESEGEGLVQDNHRGGNGDRQGERVSKSDGKYKISIEKYFSNDVANELVVLEVVLSLLHDVKSDEFSMSLGG